MYLLGKKAARETAARSKFSPSAYRRGASLWKLGRNWPEFNPGIQFAVVFVPGGVNPIDARARQTFSRSNLRLPVAYFPVRSASRETNGKGAGERLKLSRWSLTFDTESRCLSLAVR